MATIKRSGLVFPSMKQGDTYPAYVIPDDPAPEPPTLFAAGSTVLAQIRGPNGSLYHQWGGTIVEGRPRTNAIGPLDSRRHPSGEYTVEVEVTEPNGTVTTVAHAGKMTVFGDNCFAQLTPALIITGVGDGDTDGPPGVAGMRFDFQTLPFTGPGLYVTANPPDGLRVVMWFDIGLVPGPELPLTVESNGFSLTDVPASSDPGAPQTVSFFHTY